MGKVKVNSMLYFLMFDKNDLSSLAFFVYMQKLKPCKYFGYKHKMELYKEIASLTNTNINTVIKHIKILKSYGLINDTGYAIKLLSKDDQNILMSKDKVVIIPKVANTLSKIKYFLKNINLISNLNKQQKVIAYKKHLSNVYDKLQRKIFVEKKEYNMLKKAIKKGVDFKNANTSDLRLSNRKAGQLVVKCKKTITSYKKQLKKMKFLDVKTIENVFLDNVSENDFKLMKKYDFKKMPIFSFYKKSSKQVCFFSSSVFRFYQSEPMSECGS